MSDREVVQLDNRILWKREAEELAHPEEGYKEIGREKKRRGSYFILDEKGNVIVKRNKKIKK